MKQEQPFPKFSLIIAAGFIVLLVSSINFSFSQTDDDASSSGETNVVRDSVAILLDGKSLPPNDFIHVYDTTPYIIMNGHVAAKLPCDDNSVSPVKLLIGSAPNLTAAELELVSELSSPGQACLYHADLESTPSGNASNIVTDIALQNPTGNEINFNPTDSVVIGINEIHGEGQHGSEEGQHAGENTGDTDTSNDTSDE